MSCNFPLILFVLHQLFLTPLTDGVDGITMSHRLTKEELDEQFELFLKEVMCQCVDFNAIY